MRCLNKKVWPYQISIETNNLAYKVDERISKIEDILVQRMAKNIQERLYIVERNHETVYNFKNEDDYKWFVWRCV